MYTPKHKPNQVRIGTGSTIVVTGWTPIDAVAKRLDPSQYAAIGNLYNPKEGINFLFRNILLNPFIQRIILLEATQADRNSGGVRCLGDFFRQGFTLTTTPTGRDAWAPISDVAGYIDSDIPAAALGRLRENMYCIEVETVAEVLKWCDVRQAARYWAEPQDYPMTVPTATTAPGPRYGHRIEGRTVAETWVKLLHRIKSTGTIRPTGYDGQWQELIDLVAIVTDEPDGGYFPEPNFLPCDSQSLAAYIPQVLEDAPYQEGVKYTYGQRMRSWFGLDQVKQVIAKLIKEPDAASAVISLWDSGQATDDGMKSDHDRPGSPCLNHIWLRIANGEMSLTATFRSNDMFSAWPMNAMGLHALQRHILDHIAPYIPTPLTIGPLITISQSAHIYDNCWAYADDVIKAHYPKFSAPTYDDPVGNFVIELREGAIVVAHLTPQGEPLTEYIGRRPLDLVRRITAANPAIDPCHAAYLGMELQRAYGAIRESVPYQQDHHE